jgi:sugar lactone lactonase YvrE
VLVIGAGSTPALAASQPLTYTGIVGGPRLTAPEGVAVDSDGNILVVEPNAAAASTDDRLAKYSPSGTFLDVIAGPGNQPGQMYDPSGVAVAPNGDVYTVEKGTDRLQRFDALGNFVSSIGGNGSGQGQFSNPEAVAVDDQGRVYVADNGNHRIEVFDPSLLPGDPFLTSYCVVDGGVSGCTGTIVGIAVSGSTVFAVGSSTVRTYDAATGTPGTTWASSGGSGIAIDHDGNVWVTSTGNLVREYTQSGAAMATAAVGQLTAPQGLAFKGDVMYVADTGAGRIARFSVGVPEISWNATGATGIALDSGTLFVADGSSVLTFDTSGTPGISWSSPGSTGITVDGSSDVWVSSSSGVVNEYDESGTLLGTVGSTYLTAPQGVAVSAGKLFVADSGKIYRFSTAGGAPETSVALSGATGLAVSGTTLYATQGSIVKPYTAMTTPLVAGTSWGSTGASGISIDPSGNLWVASTSAQTVREYNATGTLLSNEGGPGQLTSPQGIVATASKLFVADTGAGKTVRFSIGAYDLEWGQFPGAGVLDTPSGLAIDSAGDIYVTNKNQNMIQKFASDGSYLTSFGGSGVTLLSNPTAIAVGPTGDIYIADTGNHRIEVFSNSGTYLDRWGSFGAGAGQMSSPSGIAVDATGNVYVSDTGNNRIEKFDPSHTLLWSAGSSGVSGGQFKSPKGLSLDASGNVWVTDATNGRVEKFDSAGNFLLTWGTTGSGNGQLSIPADIVFGPDGLAYVSDKGNNRVEIFTASGTFLSVLGSFGLDTGQFSAPVGLAVDPTSSATRLLVADSLNHRVEAFIDSNGPDTTLQTFPASSTKLSTANFTFTANDVNATFECKLDGAVSWDPTCNGSSSGSASYSGLTEGSHQFIVRARDAANNPGNPTTFTWSVDLTAPTISLTGGPTEGQTNNNAHPSFSFDADEPVIGFLCSLDGGAFASCTSGDSFTVADGSHTFQVKATDNAGNTGVSGTRHWTTDLTAPTVSITSGPSGITAQTSATFQFASPSDPSTATFQCNLDGVGFSACTSGINYPSLTAGQHTFQLFATDANGNNSSTIQRKWTIDTSVHRPDALIATGTSYVGDNVYNTTGSGQTKTVKAKAGSTVTFKVQIQNDGNDTDPITLTGPGTGNGYTVSYFDGTTNVTTAVKGGTCTFDLSGGQSHVITVKVKIGSTASASKSLVLKVTSGHDPTKVDAVKAVVKKA